MPFSIPAALSNDKHDARALWAIADEVSGRGRPSYFPFFYNADGMPVWLNAAFARQSAFLLASGPSARSLDLKTLEPCWALTLNNAHVTYRGNASCTVDDPSRFSLSLWMDPTVMKFMPLSHFGKSLWDNRRLVTGEESEQRWAATKLKLRDCPNVVGYRRNEKFHAPRWLHEETINWGNHAKYGGGRSVLLAAIRILYILGFRRVFLLGVDFDMSAEKRYHFAEDRTAAAVKGNNSTYAKLQAWFTELQPLFLKEQFMVYNCNPESKLTAFPHLPFEEAVAQATAHLGDYRNEQTTGMYEKYDKKLAAVSPPPAGAPKAEPAAEHGASSAPAEEERQAPASQTTGAAEEVA